VVWIPILDEDEGSEVPAASTNIDVSPQYFDGQQRIGRQLASSLDLDEVLWDAFFYFPAGAKWTEQGLPPPTLAIAQEGGVVVGTPGTLPPQADQSKLVPTLKGKAVVIGEQTNFEAILRDVTRKFVGTR
jgi:hypothetical protein